MIPKTENIVETKTCPLSGEQFHITDKDLEFLDRLSPVLDDKKYLLDTPVICHEERVRRKYSWRNERKLYTRKCDLTGRHIISIYHPDQPFPVYEQNIWWGDDWDPLEYGMNFDPNRPFFEQYQELQNKVPRICIINKQSENSDYCNYSQKNKDCYLTFGSHFNEDLTYVHYAAETKGCIDCFWAQKSEYCYDCVDVDGCYQLFYSQNSINCSNSYFLKNCIGCKDCFGCVNLRNKQYHIFNEKLSKEEYEKRIAQLNLGSIKNVSKLKQVFRDFAIKFPVKSYQGEKNENFSGDYLLNTNDCHNSFEMTDCEYCKNAIVCNNTYNSRDLTHMGYDRSEWCYELIGCSATFDCRFCESCWHDTDITYCGICFHSDHLFGCIGLKNKKYCVLNKQYSKEEYNKLVGRIIQHMKSTGEWGQFFPHEISLFGYNETIASEYFPLTQQEALQKGFNWRAEDETTSYHGEFYAPLPISDYNESLVGAQIARSNIDACIAGIHKCRITEKPFKIIKTELAFYIQNNIPIPDTCPDERHKERMKLRNPQKLFKNTCKKCNIPIHTSHAPERLEKVYCEKCYIKTVY